VSDAPCLLDVRDLAVVFDVGRHRPPLRAVDGVSLAIAERETVGLVGESGSGKTTIGRAILGLAPVTEGSVTFAGRDITRAGHAERRRLAADLQAIFQDPYSSLNPTRTIGQTLAETLRAQGERDRARLADQVASMLERVGLSADVASRYPAHFSGGQRQRIAIARALMASPRLVICDEPTSALDLSVQAQVLNLLRSLQADFGLGYLFVSHDLAVVRHVSHRIVVLYRGRVMEQGDAERVYADPVHPYTRALLAAALVPDPERQRRRRVERAAATTSAPVAAAESSCAYAARCPHVRDICRTVRPPLEPTPGGDLVACHRWRELEPAPLAALERGGAGS
jgi:oligopeptide/dipeptide ABC transporter ATP-binding protein